MKRQITALITRRRAIGLIVAVVAILTVTASAFALGSGARSEGSQSDQPPQRWEWSGAPPGEAIAADAAMRASAARSGVTAGSLRELTTSAGGYHLLVAQRPDGRVCTAGRSKTFVAGFNCLSTWSDKFAMLLYSSEGGKDIHSVDHASLVGIARTDVARVVVTAANGGTQALVLNQWRAFSYTATTAASLPQEIAAFDAAGDELQRERLAFSAPDH